MPCHSRFESCSDSAALCISCSGRDLYNECLFSCTCILQSVRQHLLGMDIIIIIMLQLRHTCIAECFCIPHCNHIKCADA
jgi:hypothetical protein